jgi:DNA-binding CsgD family transcriptional regulator
MANDIGTQATLTPTELVIADLAARGYRNREIARQLGLSPKTVEWNLTKAYRKLGVRSRTELALRVAYGERRTHAGSQR